MEYGIRMSDASPAARVATERALKWTIFFGTCAFVVYACVLILSPFLNVIAWSAVLAITFQPLYQVLVRATGRTALSALTASLLVVIMFLIPLVFMAGVAFNQLVMLVESLQKTFTDPAAIDPSQPWVRAYDWVGSHFGLDAAAVAAWVRAHASDVTRVAAQYTLKIAASVTGAVMSFLFIAFAMFLLFRDGDRIVARIPDLLPFERARSEALLVRVRDAINGGVYGIVVIALIQGGLCGLMFWLVGIPSAALFGTITVLASVIPVVGAALVWVPGALYLVTASEWTRAIVLLVWGAAVVSSVDNFLRPRLVGGRVGLSELAMFFALLGGIQVFGLLGIVLGPVVFAIAAAIVEVLTAPEARGET